MKQLLLILLAVLITSGTAFPQTPTPSPVASPRPNQIQQRPTAPFEVSEYGVDIKAEPRLIVVMAALDVAGFNPQPPGQMSAFRTILQKDLANVDPELKGRMRAFYERNLLPAPATAGDQASRYISLALALGPPPQLEAPERSDDLPAGLLEVLDFASLVREFYRRANFDEKLVGYVRAYQAEGDRLRQPAADMVRGVLTYLHTRPITTSQERVEVKTPETKRNKNTKTYNIHQKERRFFILPDLLAPRGAVNFRIIGDDYYAVIPAGTDPTSSELRRAYLEYVIDALVLRFNKEIADRRDPLKQLLDARQQAGSEVTPDIFLAVGRSLVAAADARYDESRRLEILARSIRAQLANAKDDTARAAVTKAAQVDISAIQDETVARLADEYEKGAVLAFYFSDQLKGIESSGFDIANFFTDMIASFDPARELKRPAEYSEARQRAVAARKARTAARQAESDMVAAESASNTRDTALVKELSSVEDTLRLKDYNNAEAKLKEMLKDYPGEPRIFFALAQTASLAATDATDDQVRDDRLGRALANYRLAIQASSPETDKAILSRAHESMGRINEFLDKKQEAVREFDEAIRIGEVRGGAYKEAIEGKKRLAQP
jgi:hypothetical protein